MERKGPAGHAGLISFSGTSTRAQQMSFSWTEGGKTPEVKLLFPDRLCWPGALGWITWLLRKKLKALRRNSTTSPSSVRGTWSCPDRKVLGGLLGNLGHGTTEENRRPGARPGEDQPLTKSQSLPKPLAELESCHGCSPVPPATSSLGGLHAAPLPLRPDTAIWRLLTL
jgi:hypothetical protein